MFKLLYDTVYFQYYELWFNKYISTTKNHTISIPEISPTIPLKLDILIYFLSISVIITGIQCISINHLLWTYTLCSGLDNTMACLQQFPPQKNAQTYFTLFFLKISKTTYKQLINDTSIYLIYRKLYIIFFSNSYIITEQDYNSVNHVDLSIPKQSNTSLHVS